MSMARPRKLLLRAWLASLVTLLITAISPAVPSANAGVAQSFERFVAVAENKFQWQNIFHRLPTLSQEQEIPVIARRARELPYVHLSGGRMSDDFMNRYRAGSNQIVTVVGHNDEGNYYFPDGSSVSFSQLNNKSNVLVAISCYSKDYVNSDVAAGLDRAISYEMAFDVEQRFYNKVGALIAAGEYVNASEAQRLLNQSYSESWTASGSPANVKGIVIGVAITGTAGIAIVVIPQRS